MFHKSSEWNFLWREAKNDVLNEIPKKNQSRIIIAHLNINSIRSKFEILKEVIGNKIDILLISETKFRRHVPFESVYFRRIYSTI